MGQPGVAQWKAAKPWLMGSGVLALVSLLGSFGYFALANRPAEPLAVKLLPVERGDVENTINESGTVELRGQQTFKSPIQGAVDRVLVKPGDPVRAGQVLITLRYPERETALGKQELQIQRQDFTLTRNRQRVQEARERLSVEERKLRSLRELVRTGALSQRDFLSQEDRVRDAQTALRDAQTVADTALLELGQLRLERQRIQRQLQDSVITAPIAGVVLDVAVKDGDGVEFGNDLLTIGNPSQEYIQVQLTTLDAASVRVNQPARVTVIGPDAEAFTGRVQRLHPKALQPDSQSRQGGNRNQASEQVYVPATIRLDRPSRSLIPGSQVNVEIVLDQRQDVLTLNPEVIQRAGKDSFVWLRDGEGRAQKQPITIGLEGLLQVEVKSGLRAGDQVIAPDPDQTLKPGMPIIPQK